MRVEAAHDGRSQDLDRGLGLVAAMGVIIANVVGTGVFMKARVMIVNVGTPGLVLMAWLVAGLLTLAGSLVFGELSAMAPRAGGQFNFIGAAYGRRLAFLFAWSRVIATGGGVAAIAILTVTFLNDALGGTLTPEALRLLPVGLIGVGMALNLASVRTTGLAATLLTVVKIGAVLVIAGGSFLLSDGSLDHLALSGADGAGHGVPESARLGWAGFGAAMGAALWGYNGWAIITTLGGEVRDPGRVLPRAMVFSTLLVMGLYLLVNVAYFHALTPREIADLPVELSVAGATVTRFAGRGATSVLAVVLTVSAYATMHVSLLVAARVPFAMARQGLAPAAFGKLNSQQVPALSVIVLAAAAAILAFTGTFDSLTDLTIFVLWVFFGLAGSTVLVLRRRLPDAPRPYCVPGYPVVPLVFLAVTLFMLGGMIVSTPGRCLMGMGLVALGLPLYSLRARTLPADDPQAWLGSEDGVQAP